MRAKRYIYGGTVTLALMAALGGSLWSGQTQADPQPRTPTFRVDPFWPKPLPDNWVTGEVGATCRDSQDHVFILTRAFQTGGLVSPEGGGGKPANTTPPPPPHHSTPPHTRSPTS